MSKSMLASALLLASAASLGCVGDRHPVDSADGHVSMPLIDGGPPTEVAVCDPAQLFAQSAALEGFAPFQQSRVLWAQILGSASSATAAAPRAPLVGPGDPLTWDFWEQYMGAEFWAGFPGGYHPFGVPPSTSDRGGESQLAKPGALLLAGALPSELARLTDFSTADGAPRVAALCDAYLASAEEPEVAPIQALCRELGTIVRAADVADLKVDGVRLLRAKECGLPSTAYGAFKSVGNDSPLAFDWPDFLARDPEFRQPCVGAYLHVRAEDRWQNVLGAGWVFVKAVADLAAVPFPYRERDAMFGDVDGRNGAPRGEFVSTRQLFTSGASLYLGTSPLWLLHRDELPNFAALVEALEGRSPACDLSLARPVTPCILPPQRPFLFPSSTEAVWVRQALDALNPGHLPNPDHQPFTAADRNGSEKFSDTTMLGDALADVLRFYDTTQFEGLDRQALGRAAEQLGALFHAFRLYEGRADLQRFRTPMLPLGDGLFLAVPDQGYFQLGTPTLDTLSKLQMLDFTGALGVDRQNCSDSLFTFNDVVITEQER